MTDDATTAADEICEQVFKSFGSLRGTRSESMNRAGTYQQWVQGSGNVEDFRSPADFLLRGLREALLWSAARHDELLSQLREERHERERLAERVQALQERLEELGPT